MNLAIFSLFTLAGSGIWNTALVGLGAALGTQYALVDRYSRYLNYAVYAAVAAVVLWLIVRRIRATTDATSDATTVSPPLGDWCEAACSGGPVTKVGWLKGLHGR